MTEALQHRPRLNEVNGFKVDENGGLVTLDVTLTCRTPLLMNAMGQAQLLAIRDKTKKSKTAAKPGLREEAESKLHVLSDGRPCMPPNALYACMIGAGTFVRMDGKRQVSTAKSTNLPGILTLDSAELPLFVPGTDDSATWEVDIQQGRNPNGGEAVCLVRPRFDAWEISCELTLDQSQMALNVARELVDIAGNRVGLLDFRPQRKGIFGRFHVTKWAVKLVD